MDVFAIDEGLLRVALQVFLDLRRPVIHTAAHIGGIGIALVVRDALIVNDTAGVTLTQGFGHIVNILAAEALVAAAPD